MFLVLVWGVEQQNATLCHAMLCYAMLCYCSAWVKLVGSHNVILVSFRLLCSATLYTEATLYIFLFLFFPSLQGLATMPRLSISLERWNRGARGKAGRTASHTSWSSLCLCGGRNISATPLQRHQRNGCIPGHRVRKRCSCIIYLLRHDWLSGRKDLAGNWFLLERYFLLHPTPITLPRFHRAGSKKTRCHSQRALTTPRRSLLAFPGPQTVSMCRPKWTRWENRRQNISKNFTLSYQRQIRIFFLPQQQVVFLNLWTL